MSNYMDVFETFANVHTHKLYVLSKNIYLVEKRENFESSALGYRIEFHNGVVISKYTEKAMTLQWCLLVHLRVLLRILESWVKSVDFSTFVCCVSYSHWYDAQHRRVSLYNKKSCPQNADSKYKYQFEY